MMKYKCMIVPILIICLLCCGCNKTQNQTQIIFYYCNNQMDYKANNSAIGSEICNEPIDHLDYDKLLTNYLSGPHSTNLISPFPSGTSLINFSLDQQSAHVVLSDTFATLTGVELTIACVCISKTVENMTNCATVTISAQNALLDNQESIIIDAQNIFLTDHVHP